jgi:GTP-binding protein HflX
LKELGASNKEILTVYNKIDHGDQITTRLKAQLITPDCHFISCKSGEGINQLLSTLEDKLSQDFEVERYSIPHQRYDLISKLREQGCICSEEIDGDGYRIKASPRGKLANLIKEFLD